MSIPSESETAARWRWVPVRSLAPRHRERILAHLLLLDERSRYLRFGYTASDAQIARYVDGIDFQRDEAFGIFNRRLELVAMAHLAYRMADDAGGGPSSAEFGVSVLASARRRGFGGRLFEHAVLHARNRGVQTLVIHALTENAAMLALARRFGAVLDRRGPDTDGSLRLPPESFGSHVDQLLGDSAAEIDYRLKWQAHHGHVADGVPRAARRPGPPATPANERVAETATTTSGEPR